MSEVKVNKLSPRSGTTVTLGDSGDTFTIPSGVTLANSGTITTGGLTTTGNIDFGDSDRARFGASQDLQIFHDGTNSKIQENGTGQLILDSNGNGVYFTKSDSEYMAKMITDGAVELYYDNSKKFETTSTGATVTGNLTASGNLTSLGIDDNATSTAITINSSQDVNMSSLGISNTSPVGQLHIHNFSGGDGFRITRGAGITGVGMHMQTNSTSNFLSAYGDLILRTNTTGTGTNGTERMRIDTSGNVGIGTTSPSARLETKNATDGSTFAFQATNDNDHEIVQIGAQSDGDGYLTVHGQGASTNIKVQLHSDGDSYFTGGRVGIGTSSPDSPLDILTSGNSGLEVNAGTNSAHRIYLGNTGGTSVVGTLSNHNFAIVNNGSEHMRITTDGVVGIGTSSPSSSYRLSTVGGSSGAVVGAFIETTSTDSGHEASIIKRPNSGVLVQFLGSGQVGSITTNGSTTTYGTSSDYRLKENVVDLTNATERLKQLQPKRFNFISDADTTVDGFLAHEVSSVVPEAIHGTKDEIDTDGNPKYQNIDQSKLVPLLVKTIQELEARITTLENA